MNKKKILVVIIAAVLIGVGVYLIARQKSGPGVIAAFIHDPGSQITGIPFDLELSHATDAEGRPLVGEIFVAVRSDLDEPPEVFSSYVRFHAGIGAVKGVILTTPGNHTLTVAVAGVTVGEVIVPATKAADIYLPALAIFRPTDGNLGPGTWYIDTSRNGVFDPAVDVMLGGFGKLGGDIPLAIDWDGDGRQELAIFRPTGGVLGNGTWYIDTSQDGMYQPDLDVTLGPFGRLPGDVPLAIDWDGDGRQELASFRPVGGGLGRGTWYIDINRDGVFDPAIDVMRGPFGGEAGDIPLAIDWNGDGRQELAIFRPTGGVLGNGTWYIDTSRDGTFQPDLDVTLGAFGKMAGDIPLAIDWDGDGRQELAIYRPTGGPLGNGTWYIDTSRDGKFDAAVDVVLGPFGGEDGDIPLAITWGHDTVHRQ